MNLKPEYSREQLLRSKIPGTQTGIEVKKTLCAICGSQCGIDAYVKDGCVVKVEGTETNPKTKGHSAQKDNPTDSMSTILNGLHTPLVRVGVKGSGEYSSLTWDEALDRIAGELLKIKASQDRSRLFFLPVIPNGFGHSFSASRIHLAHRIFAANRAPAFSPRLSLIVLTYGCFSDGSDLKNAACILNWSGNPYNCVPRIAPFKMPEKEAQKLSTWDRLPPR